MRSNKSDSSSVKDNGGLGCGSGSGIGSGSGSSSSSENITGEQITGKGEPASIRSHLEI